ncbi:MAG: protein transport protein subunit gamma [Thermoplasmata archaeon]|jgi:protein transport protein SEC61 subunit gamma-like protein|nr:protein transport protein subunit gamma [Thermoplasmata archaeon]
MMATAAPTTQKPESESFVGKAWDAQEKLEGRLATIGKGKYGRVIRMARKPTPEEYRKAAVVSAIGMGILGAMGFLIFYLMSFIPH